jgi:putative peptidoglycan lipid II flippase
VRQTALALAAYAPGLLFVGVSRVVVPTFYAMQDTRTPVWISFWTLLVNAGLGLLLMGPLRHTGLAIALTLASVFNAVVLIWVLRRKVGRLGLAPVGASFLRLLPLTALMAAAVWGVLGYGEWSASDGRLLKGVVLGGALLAGVAVYAGGCLLLRIPEATEAAALLRRKLLRRA